MNEEYENFVLIKKDEKGAFISEMDTFSLPGRYLAGLNAIESSDGLRVELLLTIDRELTDLDFDFVFDAYDEMIFEGLGEVSEAPGYNPTWRFILPYMERDELESRLIEIINKHEIEIEEIKQMLDENENED